ncbi:MAG: hypothetical protein WBN31_03970 [Gammaproteobacteria bacterium]
MNATNHLLRVLVLGACVSLASACGGGGGGGDDNPPVVVNPGNPGIPTGDATIANSNALEIAGAAVIGGLFGGDPGVLGGAGLIGADSGGNAPHARVSARVASKGLAVIAGKPFGPETSSCALTGSVTASGNLASDETLTAGDVFNLRFNRCDDGDGQIFDGAVTMTVDTFEGDLFSGFMVLGATLAMQNLAVTEDGEVLTFNGGSSLLLDTLDYPQVTASSSGTSMSMTGNARTMSLSNFSSTTISDESSYPPSYSIDASGRVGLAPHGWVNYTVQQAFTGFGDADPDRGVILVTGSGGTTITATAQEDGQVSLQMDYNGDGISDETRMVSWADLRG